MGGAQASLNLYLVGCIRQAEPVVPVNQAILYASDWHPVEQ